MIRNTLLATALAAAAALPAAAEGWSISKLGTMPDVDTCMNLGRIVLNRYIFDHGGGETTSDSWSIYGFDLEPNVVDAVIMCPIGGGDYVNAMLVMHSEGTDRSFQIDEITRYWDNN